ncbi:MAG: hypothetical protein HY820_11590 [Acidobacteria bacterium]|nr:hypothetical protein [Acidobacteriota bacterium]
MNRRTATLTIASALTGARLDSAPLPRPAPDVAVRLPGGRRTRPADYKGKVLVLSFILTT